MMSMEIPWNFGSIHFDKFQFIGRLSLMGDRPIFGFCIKIRMMFHGFACQGHIICDKTTKNERAISALLQNLLHKMNFDANNLANIIDILYNIKCKSSTYRNLWR